MISHGGPYWLSSIDTVFRLQNNALHFVRAPAGKVPTKVVSSPTEDLVGGGEQQGVLPPHDVAQVHAHQLHVGHHGPRDLVYVYVAYAALAVQGGAVRERGGRGRRRRLLVFGFFWQNED